MYKTRLFEWAKWFKQGCELINDDPRQGVPVTARTDVNVDSLRLLITSDWRLNIRALSDEFNINKKPLARFEHAKDLRKVDGQKFSPMNRNICENSFASICCHAFRAKAEIG